MGHDELDQFLDGEYGPGWNPPIGFGSAGAKWRDCSCYIHGVMLSLSRPETAFILDRFLREHREEFLTLIDAIVHVRGAITPN